MGVQRFIGANTREAMRQVRTALGEDVLILSNRVVDAGVEIVAMSEQAHEQAMQTTQAAEPQRSSVADAGQPSTFEAQPSAPAAGETLHRQLLDEVRALLKAPSQAGAADSRSPVLEALRRRLSEAGFSAGLSETLLESLPEEVRDAGDDSEAAGDAWLRRQLAARLDTLEDEEALFDAGGVFALVGPTGAGKTTTTAKLASRYVMRHGPRDVALVTTDSYRIGAAEQLRIYARLLGVEVHALDEQGDLGTLLGRLVQPRRGLMSRAGGKRLMVIDTVGMSQRDQRLMGEIARLGAAPVPVRRLLVLDAARHGDTLEQVIEAWQSASLDAGEPLWGCVLTKLDEAARLGPVLDVLIRHGLKLCYLSRGQRVPEDLEPVALDALLRQALSQGGESPFSSHVASQPVAPAQARHQALSQGVLRQGQALETTFASLRRQVQGVSELEQAWARIGEPKIADESFAGRMAAASRQTGSPDDRVTPALWWSKPLAAGAHGLAMPLVALDPNGLPEPRVWPRHALPAGDDARFDWAESLGVEWHLLTQLPASELLARLDVQGRRWSAAVGASRRVLHSGEWLRLDEAMTLGEAQAPMRIFHRGRPAVLHLQRLETTLAARRSASEGLPVIGWQGIWVDTDDGRRLGCRYWIASARTGVDMASRLAAALTLEALPNLTLQADRLLQTRRPELIERASRWQLAAALAALSLRLAQEENDWAMDVRARLSDIAQRRCARRPKALLEALMDALSARQTLMLARAPAARLASGS